jgi:nucleoid-associated protein YgaU
MKYRVRSRLKGILFPAIAAFFLGVGIIGCSSSSEEAAPDAALSENGEAVNSDPLANDANAKAAGGEGAAADGKTANNEELTNLVSEGSDNAAAGENPALDPGLNANAGNDPFANPAAAPAAGADAAANGTGALPIGGENNGADPFANGDAGANATANAANAPVENAPAANVTAESAPAEEIPAGNLPAWKAGNANNAPANAAGDVAENNASNANEPAMNNASNAVSGPSTGFVPEKGAKLAYYVSRGDTLGTIAQKIYGNKARWKELASNNNLTDPNKIYPGDALLYTLDDASQGFAEKYEGASKQSVTVKSGDTLSGIAAKIFGSQGTWRTLWKENPSVTNPDRIAAGMTLYYRAGGSVAQMDDQGEVVSSLEAQE